MAFSEELKQRIDDIISKSETNQSALIPTLHEVQRHLGWISDDSMREVSEILNISAAGVQNVATFYTMFFRKPVGKHVIWLCRTLSCALRGAELVEHHLCHKLGVRMGDTTPDGKITLLEAECLASCGTAPAMLVDDTLLENITRAQVDELIETLRND
ncbi:MAG: NADH-quinone oxidoreductase subunit NuoE [Deltaproteobacteria bacterium]